MPTSRVSFQEKPLDDVCVHLISGNGLQCTQLCATPDEASSLPSGDLQLPQKYSAFRIDLRKYQIVFKMPKIKEKWFSRHNWRWFLTKLPLFTITISVVQVIFYCELTPELRQQLNFDPQQRSEVYRFLTYMLLHVGALHLAFNVLLQHILGTPLEMEQGHIRTAMLYIGGGVGGAIGAAAIEPTTVVEGASAGVYAILMGHVPHIILNYHELSHKRIRMAVVLIFLMADVGFLVYHVTTSGNVSPTISIPAHAFGALSGLILGLIFFKGTSRWNAVLKCLALCTYVILVIIAYLYS